MITQKKARRLGDILERKMLPDKDLHDFCEFVSEGKDIDGYIEYFSYIENHQTGSYAYYNKEGVRIFCAIDGCPIPYEQWSYELELEAEAMTK